MPHPRSSSRSRPLNAECAPRSSRYRAAALWSLAALLPAATGCQQVMALIANVQGGDYIEAEFKPTKTPLLILIDDAFSDVSEPRALREVHKVISQEFVDRRVNSRVIPFEHWQDLQRTDDDYDALSIRQIGEKLGADQVIYLRVVRFAVTDDPGSDIFRGEFSVRVKVITTDPIRETRLWPERSRNGRLVTAKTLPEPVDGDRSSFDVAKEVSAKLGHKVARLFYGYRELNE